MQNSQPLGNPHEHFASLWNGQAADGQQKSADSYATIWRTVEQLANDAPLPQRAFSQSPSFEGSERALTSTDTSQDDFQSCWRACGEFVGVELNDYALEKEAEGETRHAD